MDSLQGSFKEVLPSYLKYMLVIEYLSEKTEEQKDIKLKC